MKKRISAKAKAIIVAAILLVTAIVGATVAYLADKTPSLSNSFQPVAVTCLVQETYDSATKTKTDVSVKNTGDIPAYVRATVVVTWVSESGTTYGGAPELGTDYVAEFSADGWIKGTDGFYYCASPVGVGASTPVLLKTASPVEGKAPDGYVLSVQIIASAIQASPADAVTSAWSGVVVHSDGTITPQ